MNLRIYLAGRRPLAAAAVWLVCAACGFFFLALRYGDLSIGTDQPEGGSRD